MRDSRAACALADCLTMISLAGCLLHCCCNQDARRAGPEPSYKGVRITLTAHDQHGDLHVQLKLQVCYPLRQLTAACQADKARVHVKWMGGHAACMHTICEGESGLLEVAPDHETSKQLISASASQASTRAEASACARVAVHVQLFPPGSSFEMSAQLSGILKWLHLHIQRSGPHSDKALNCDNISKP